MNRNRTNSKWKFTKMDNSFRLILVNCCLKRKKTNLVSLNAQRFTRKQEDVQITTQFLLFLISIRSSSFKIIKVVKQPTVALEVISKINGIPICKIKLHPLLTLPLYQVKVQLSSRKKLKIFSTLLTLVSYITARGTFQSRLASITVKMMNSRQKSGNSFASRARIILSSDSLKYVKMIDVA